MSLLKLCNNDPLVELMRKTFGANPVRVPDDRIQPLAVFGVNGDNKQYLGMINKLLSGDTGPEVITSKSQLANVSSSSSKKVSADLGLKVMDGFLSGLGKNSLGISASFKGATKVSFSFNNVHRISVDIIALMGSFGKFKADIANPVTKAFIDGSMQCILVTGIIVSNNFTMKVEESEDDKFALDIPEIQGLISSKGNKVQIKGNSATEIAFKGDKELPFAFEAIKLLISFDGSIDLDEEPDKMFLTVVPEDVDDQKPLPMFIDEEEGLADIEYEF